MKIRILGCVLALLSVLHAASAWADDVMLHDGHSVTASLVSTSESGVRVTVELPDGGSSTYDIAASGLDPHWFYAVRNAALKEDAKGRLQLALWAFENGLFNRARVQYTQVQKLDPDLAQKYKSQIVPGLREGIADTMVANAQRQLDAGRYGEAKTLLSKVITALGDTQAATKARAMIPGVQQKIDKATRLRETQLVGESDEKTRAQHKEGKRLLRPVREEAQHARKIENRALSGEHSSASLSSFAQAAGAYHRVLERIKQLQKSHADNTGLMKDLANYEQLARKGWIECHANRAQIFLSRGDHHDAKSEERKINKFAAGSPEALQLASEIESAQSANGQSWYWQGDHAFGHHRRRR